MPTVFSVGNKLELFEEDESVISKQRENCSVTHTEQKSVGSFSGMFQDRNLDVFSLLPVLCNLEVYKLLTWMFST